MTKILAGLGLTRDSLIFFWTKIVGLAGLIVTGVIDPAALGLTERQKHAVMVTCGAIAYLAGQLSTSGLPGKHDDANTVNVSKLGPGAALVLACALTGVAVSGCGSHGPLQVATIAETGIVHLVHAAVGSEAAAYAGGVYSSAQHQKNVAALLKVNAGEAALNAALRTWAANVGQPAPAAIHNAVAALTPILADLAPLLGTSGSAATFAADLSAILAALQAPAATVLGGK